MLPGLALLDYGRFTATALAAKDSNSRNGMVLQGFRRVPCGGRQPQLSARRLQPAGRSAGDCVRTDGPAAPRHRMAYEFAEFCPHHCHTRHCRRDSCPSGARCM